MINAIVAYLYALRHLPVSTVSLYAYVNPVIAVGLGALVLGEPFSVRVIIAAALVLVGLGVVRSSGRGARPASGGVPHASTETGDGPGGLLERVTS